MIIVLFFSFLCISPCFNEPAQAASLGQYASQIQSTPLACQLFFACLLQLNAQVDILTLNCFSPSAVNCIKGATSATILIQLTSAALLTCVINVCVRLTALCRANPAVYKIFLGKSVDCQSALDRFYAAAAQNPIAKACWDVKSLPNFGTALFEVGLVVDLVIINLAILIVIVLIFNQTFVNYCKVFFSGLIAVILEVIAVIEVLLIDISVLLGAVIFTILGLAGGLLVSLATLLKGLLFPTCFGVVNVCIPSLFTCYSQDFLKVLVLLPAKFPYPNAKLQQASNLFNLLNAVSN
jgi:hypothetical protein